MRRGAPRQWPIPAVSTAHSRIPRVSLNPKDIRKIIHSKTGHNSIFDVEIAGRGEDPSDRGRRAVSSRQGHADAHRPEAHRPDAESRVSVPVHVKGEAKGVKEQGGVLDWSPRASKSSASRTISRINSRGCHRADDRHEHPRLRPAGEDGSMKLLTAPEAVIAHVVGIAPRKCRRRRKPLQLPVAAAPLPPSPKWRRRARRKRRRRRAGRRKRARRNNRECSWWPVLVIPASSMPHAP